MNYAYSTTYRSGTALRGGLMGIVAALHAGVLLLILAAKTVAPVLMEMPLMVQFIEPPKPVEVAAAPRPLPVAPPKREIVRPRADPVVPKRVPVPQQPQLETTTSTEPAPSSAPVAAESAPAVAPLAALPGRGTGPSTGNGGDSVGARFDADYLRNPAPPYPPQSRRLGEEGKVILRVFVTADGNAQEVEVKTSSGSSRLDESARKTVRQWKFVPAKRGGVAVESWVLVPIVFKLEE
jgi:protein TonB